MASDDSAPQHRVDPRGRSMESWRSRLGVMASRGEVSGPRVDECKKALSIWRTRTFLIREMNISPERADALIDELVADKQVEHSTPDPAEAVSP